MILTEEIYEANIPECCELKTFRAHCDIVGICWGLAHNIKAGKTTECGICDFNTEVTDEDRKLYWAKQRTWDILNER
jgi:hypothetical protein